ncbi:hypothetical protein [Costertonia aggregata]|uniref:Uncharacterized protein n=1 Tax=Costertonia aggregata TaxID=343403 RepID=A0A7H9AL32_9FLAO|nr:hypothetical protein [Costertonia aggregata]QLG44107.1 hypothetical protein HYG79_01660 [Costertonia aggregata]
MKNITLLLVIMILISSCKKNNETKKIIDEIQITETLSVAELENKNSDLTENNSDNIQNIKTQIDEYLTAFLNGNSEKAITYCYPDLFEFMKSQYPQEYSIEEVKSVFKESIDALKEMSVNGVEYEFEVGEINKIAENNDFKLYSIVTYLKVKKGLDSNTSGGEQIAISNDNGKTWKFLEKDANKNYLKVLKLSIPNEIVNRIK